MTKSELRKLIAENNLKSPEVITAYAYPESNWDACRVAGIFLDCTETELPYSFEAWQRSIQAPVELYFVFKRKKQLMAFLKQVRKEMPNIRIIL